MNEDLLVAV